MSSRHTLQFCDETPFHYKKRIEISVKFPKLRIELLVIDSQKIRERVLMAKRREEVQKVSNPFGILNKE